MLPCLIPLSLHQPYKTLAGPFVSPKHPYTYIANMQITLASTLLFLFTATTIATTTLEARATSKTHLYVCTGNNWGGTCKNMKLSIGRCYNMEKAFNNNVSSAGPDDGTFCTLYS